MAVLIENNCIVFRLEAIRQKMRGGEGAFQARFGHMGCCTDGEIVRLSFIAPAEVENFAQLFEREGFIHMQGGKAVDFVVVNQLRGVMNECDWIEYGAVTGDGNRVQAARLKGSSLKNLSAPLGWAFAFSQSDMHRKVEARDLPPGAEPVGDYEGTIVYRDPKQPARTFYVEQARP